MTGWGWIVDGDDQVHGQFSTREEAIADAAAACSPGTRVGIGRCVVADAEAFLPSIGSVVDGIEERACDPLGGDFAWCDDDNVFELIGDEAEAEAELDAALGAWARKWLFSSKWFLDVDETISLPLEVAS